METPVYENDIYLQAGSIAELKNDKIYKFESKDPFRKN